MSDIGVMMSSNTRSLYLSVGVSLARKLLAEGLPQVWPPLLNQNGFTPPLSQSLVGRVGIASGFIPEFGISLRGG